jgi:hypothetical protein
MPEQSLPIVTPTPTGQPNNLPITKDVVVGAKVIKVLYEVKANPNYTTGSAETNVSATVRGDIRALVVSVPRNVVEILDYGIQNGTLRVSVRYPDSATGKDGASPGVSWDDLAAYWVGTPALAADPCPMMFMAPARRSQPRCRPPCSHADGTASATRHQHVCSHRYAVAGQESEP